jgi:hypothetical protein
MSPEKRAAQTKIKAKSNRGSNGRGEQKSSAKPAAAVAKTGAVKAAGAKPARSNEPIPAQGQPIAVKSSESEPRVRLAVAERPDMKPGQEGRYVYGIIESTEPSTFGKSGIGGSGDSI